MRTKRIIAVSSAAALAVAGSFALHSSASADSLEADVQDARTGLVGNVDAEMLSAMTDTFDLTEAEAYDRLALEDVAQEMESELSARDGFAGLWVNEDGDDIMAAFSGVTPSNLEISTQSVSYSLAELEEFTALLDAQADDVSTEGWSWWGDVTANNIVIEADDAEAATVFATDAGLPEDVFEIDTTRDVAEPQYVLGGDTYGGCSIAFAVTQSGTPGFTTAGHCGSVGDSVTSGNAAPGTFEESIFPDQDAAWVSVGTDKDLRAEVNTYDGSTTAVSNSNEAAVGASICRSGQTTGWECGVIEAKGLTIDYAEGTVYDMTRTTACSQPGDSGGSHISGSSAQGIHSGGSGNCSGGGDGDALFYPLNPVLSQWSLSLVTN